jgi:hypothetical protein
MAKRISKEAEDKILSAVEKTSEYVSDGLHPNDAIVKAASEDDLQPGHVRLLIQAYNTGRTNLMRKSGNDIFEKSANFPLAEPSTVLEKLYPSNIKEAADRHVQQTVVSHEYEQPPSWINKAAERELVKQSVAPLTEKRAEAYPVDDTIRMKKAEGLLISLERQREQMRMEVSRTFDKVASTIDNLDYHFRIVGNRSTFHTVAANAESLWGHAGKVVMEKVAQASPLPFSERRPNYVPGKADLNREPYTFIKAALAAIKEHTQAKRAFESFEKEAMTAGTKLAGHFLPPIAKVHRGSILKEYGPEKQAFGPGAAFISGLSNYGGFKTMEEVAKKITPKPEDKLKTDAYLALEDPAHEARLRGIRSQATLHDMLANDEFISGEDPNKVVKVYNEIVKLSPRSADQPMLVRALIRRYMAQGQVDPHDVDQLVGIETKMKMRDEPSKEIHLPKVPGSSLVTQAPKTDEVRKLSD